MAKKDYNNSMFLQVLIIILLVLGILSLLATSLISFVKSLNVLAVIMLIITMVGGIFAILYIATINIPNIQRIRQEKSGVVEDSGTRGTNSVKFKNNPSIIERKKIEQENEFSLELDDFDDDYYENTGEYVDNYNYQDESDSESVGEHDSSEEDVFFTEVEDDIQDDDNDYYEEEEEDDEYDENFWDDEEDDKDIKYYPVESKTDERTQTIKSNSTSTRRKPVSRNRYKRNF